MTGGPISWLSKKQPIVDLTTSEAEYIAPVHSCPTNKMLADILTKPLSKGRFQEFCQAMGMIQLMEYIPHDN